MVARVSRVSLMRSSVNLALMEDGRVAKPMMCTPASGASSVGGFSSSGAVTVVNGDVSGKLDEVPICWNSTSVSRWTTPIIGESGVIEQVSIGTDDSTLSFHSFGWLQQRNKIEEGRKNSRITKISGNRHSPGIIRFGHFLVLENESWAL